MPYQNNAQSINNIEQTTDVITNHLGRLTHRAAKIVKIHPAIHTNPISVYNACICIYNYEIKTLIII